MCKTRVFARALRHPLAFYMTLNIIVCLRDDFLWHGFRFVLFRIFFIGSSSFYFWLITHTHHFPCKTTHLRVRFEYEWHFICAVLWSRRLLHKYPTVGAPSIQSIYSFVSSLFFNDAIIIWIGLWIWMWRLKIPQAACENGMAKVGCEQKIFVSFSRFFLLGGCLFSFFYIVLSSANKSTKFNWSRAPYRSQLFRHFHTCKIGGT